MIRLVIGFYAFIIAGFAFAMLGQSIMQAAIAAAALN